LLLAHTQFYEDKEWVRVKDSKLAKPLGIKESVVYDVSVDYHRLVIGDTIFADYAEIDDPTTTYKTALEMLNKEGRFKSVEELCANV